MILLFIPKGGVFWSPLPWEARGKGGILFSKRIPPLYPPEKDEGRPPSTPDIAGLILE